MTEHELKTTIFNALVAHLRTDAYSLHAIRRFHGGGIEGWFKVEVVAALTDLIDKVRNEGADLLLKDGTEIELKAGCGLDAAYIRKGALKYNVPCFFLGYGGNLALLNMKQVKLLTHTTLFDGYDNWIIGIVVPENQ